MFPDRQGFGARTSGGDALYVSDGGSSEAVVVVQSPSQLELRRDGGELGTGQRNNGVSRIARAGIDCSLIIFVFGCYALVKSSEGGEKNKVFSHFHFSGETK